MDAQNTTAAFLTRAKLFFEERANPWWEHIVCKWSEARRRFVPELLLSAILLQLQQLNESQQQGTYWRATPFTLIAGDEALRVLDIETQGRVREVDIWMDALPLGAPFPTIRLSTSASGSSAGGGIQMQTGTGNVMGKVPPDTKLYLSSDTTISGYIIERA